jgi:acyl-CoA synthetase (AMP-forming)/AMP-acid ligase II
MERKASSSSLPLMLERLDGYGMGGLRSPVRGEEVAERIMRGSPDQCDLISFLPRSQCKAIVDPIDTSKSTTHADLAAFVEDFDMRKFGIAYGCRVALILPNGPHLAVCLICTVSRWCAAPINSTGPAHEIQSELESTKAQVVIILRGRTNNDAVISAATALGLGVLELIPSPSKSGLFTLEMSILVPVSASAATHTVAETVPGFKAYSHPETVLLLHTSGTSGNKKCVPYSLDMILTGVGCIISSWNLGPLDICLNMMPLFHIGGIMRNVLSPILSGGAVITCNAFDAALFWNILASHRFTWYYAAPTMHHAILKASEDVTKPLPIETVRYIANAAGGLLPVLAQSLKDTFPHAVILTSYGMTECMPISSPPQNYALDPIGTSGKAVGPDILICDEEHTVIEPVGKVFF